MATNLSPPSVAPPQTSKPRLTRRQKEALAFFLFASPWLLGFVLFVAGPMIASFVLSFTDYDLLTPAKFVGLGNLERAFVGADHELFWHSLRITVIFAVTSVPLQLVGGFLTAVLMNQDVRGIYGFRAIYYLPAVMSGVATAILWRFVFSYQYGVFNYFLSVLGIEPVMWLGFDWALPSLVIVSAWNFGGATIIYLAGFKAIPSHLYEAAEIDGAGALARFRHVTIPMISPVIFFNLVMGIIAAFQQFTSAYVVIGGGGVTQQSASARAAYLFMWYFYDVGFKDHRMGYAALLAWVLFVIIAVLTYVTVRVAGPRVYYEGAKVR